MNLKYIMINLKSFSSKNYYCMIQFIRNFRRGKILVTEMISGFQEPGDMGERSVGGLSGVIEMFCVLFLVMITLPNTFLQDASNCAQN